MQLCTKELISAQIIAGRLALGICQGLTSRKISGRQMILSINAKCLHLERLGEQSSGSPCAVFGDAQISAPRVAAQGPEEDLAVHWVLLRRCLPAKTILHQPEKRDMNNWEVMPSGQCCTHSLKRRIKLKSIKGACFCMDIAFTWWTYMQT